MKAAEGRIAPSVYGQDLLRDIELALDQPRMGDIAMGAALNDIIVIDLINGIGNWTLSGSIADRLRRLRYRFRPRRKGGISVAAGRARILVAWKNSTRIDDLMLPIVRAFGAEHCAVLHERPDMDSVVPKGTELIEWSEAIPHDPAVWSATCAECWPQWQRRLLSVCKRHALPSAAYHRLILHLLLASQLTLGCLEFLRRYRPTAVLTEHDRSSHAACLVLAARSLGIPTYTLQHGVLDLQATGYAPLLADKVFCWGETSRQRFESAGVDADAIQVAGCPRIDRELRASASESRQKHALDPVNPVVMLGTSPINRSERLQIAETFCAGMELLRNATGLVRLHASETLDTYTATILRHPTIRFIENRAMTLDEAMAIADVVAVQNSGFGSDALVKRRLVVVIDIPPSPLEHGLELVHEAGCPRVETPRDFADAVGRILFDKEFEGAQSAAAERYVARFCASFGQDSARRIADAILHERSDSKQEYSRL